jgi:hypothetical protein
VVVISFFARDAHRRARADVSANQGLSGHGSSVVVKS